MAEPQSFPVLVNFDWERPESRATYDPDTGQLTMRIRPDSRLAQIMAMTDDEIELRTLSFGYTVKRYTVAATCQARYENNEIDPQRTHTCDEATDHEGPHHCPLCGKYWIVEGIDA